MNKKDNSQIHPRLVNYWDEEIMLQKKSNGLCGLKKKVNHTDLMATCHTLMLRNCLIFKPVLFVS